MATKKAAREYERKFLATYAYAWNKKKKCKVRRIAMDGIPFFILF